MKHLIELEDNGQDFLLIHVEDNFIIKTEPFQTDIWEGSYVPIEDVKVGEEMPIHKPPHINFGYLKHKVESIKELNP